MATYSVLSQYELLPDVQQAKRNVSKQSSEVSNLPNNEFENFT